MSGGGLTENPSGGGAAAAPASGTSSPAPIRNFPAAMPGQLEAIAQQLGRGFGQQPADVMTYLNSIYKPPASTTRPASNSETAKPKTATGSQLASQLKPMLGYEPRVMFKGNLPYVYNPSSGGWVPYGMAAGFHRSGDL